VRIGVNLCEFARSLAEKNQKKAICIILSGTGSHGTLGLKAVKAASGKTADIARRLHRSVKTVATYRDRIRQKLDLSDGTKLAHYATQWALEQE
jgi:chemotaxis response regulator CheB